MGKRGTDLWFEAGCPLAGRDGRNADDQESFQVGCLDFFTGLQG